MYRARYRHVLRDIAVGATHSVALRIAHRLYTPIYTPASSVDHMESVRLADEMNTLWSSTATVPSLPRAVELWLRYGNDPVVHTRRSLLAGSPVARSIHELQTATHASWGGDGADDANSESSKPNSSNSGSSSDTTNKGASSHLASKDGGPLFHAAQELTRSNSPFAFVEDYMGTNLVRSGDPTRVRESAELWLAYFERRYVGRMRQSRRTAANFIGKPIERGGGATLSGLSGSSIEDAAEGAAAVTAGPLFTDEADQPNTPWTRDTVFGELAYLSERHLKFKPVNMLQLDQQLWYAATPEQLVAYFDALQQQTTTRVPLPVPAIWYLEGPARLAWASNYLSAARASRAFFDGPLTESIRQLSSNTTSRDGSDNRSRSSSSSSSSSSTSNIGGSSANGSAIILQRVSEQMSQVYALERQRARRQVADGLRPDWHAEPTHAHTARQCQEWTENELERWQRSVQENVYDAEDMLDTSEAWRSENAQITTLMQRPVDGCCFTLHDFWCHTIRREELETQHILEMDKLRAIAARARDALYRESTLEDVHAELRESLARGQLDLRAASFRPQLRPVWCKWHYAKFGASTTTQHTTTASRQLLFHFAATVREVAGSAMLYYTSKPMSSALDYSSPYTWRRSMGRLCASYGLDMMHATQAPIFQSTAQLARAEDVITRTVNQVARRCGRRRRLRKSALRAHARLTADTNAAEVRDVWVGEVPQELLSTGEQLELPSQRLDGSHTTSSQASRVVDNGPVYGKQTAKDAVRDCPRITEWPLGSRKVVHYHWPCPAWQVQRQEWLARSVSRSPGATAPEPSLSLLDSRDATPSGVWLEVSLWRRCGAAERAARRRRAGAEARAVSRAVASTPVLAEVARYALGLYEHLSPLCRRQPRVSKNAGRAGAERAASARVTDAHTVGHNWQRGATGGDPSDTKGHATESDGESTGRDDVHSPPTPPHTASDASRSNRDRLEEGEEGEEEEDRMDEEEDGEWVFETMLDDRVAVNVAECADVYLPYTDASGAALPAGEYRVCVRGYTLPPQSAALPILCEEDTIRTGVYSEAVSEPFVVRDVLEQAITRFIASTPQSTRPDSGAASSRPAGTLSSCSATNTTRADTSSSASSAAVRVVPGELLVDLCAQLRQRGLDVPLRCEFEAGQTLDPHGNVFVEPFVQALRSSEHHRPLSEARLTAAQRAMEPDCRAHWELYHPGATAVEWARVRRAVLHWAVQVERDWWLPDALLSVRDNPVTASSAHASLGYDMYAAVARYGNELCGVLHAEGCCTDGGMARMYPDSMRTHTARVPNVIHRRCDKNDSSSSSSSSSGGGGGIHSENEDMTRLSAAPAAAASRPGDTGEADANRDTPSRDGERAGMVETTGARSHDDGTTDARACVVRARDELPVSWMARCTVDGTGAATSLQFVQTGDDRCGAAESPATMSIDAALDMAFGAIRAAQNRHCTLSMFKLGAFEKQAQVSTFCNVHGLEFGGKYGRTYCYALEQAKTELAELEMGGRREVGVRDGDVERVSDKTHVDRFASSTHPEQRKTRFVPRTTLSGVNMEDPTPDQTSTWRH